MFFNSRCASVYHIGYPVVARSVFGMWGSYYFVGARAALAIIWYGVQRELLRLTKSATLDWPLCSLFGSKLHVQHPTVHFWPQLHGYSEPHPSFSGNHVRTLGFLSACCKPILAFAITNFSLISLLLRHSRHSLFCLKEAMLTPNSTQGMLAFFLFWLVHFPFCAFRPYQLRAFFWFKSIIVLPAVWGLFIFCMVNTKGNVGSVYASKISNSKGWFIM